MPPEIAHIEREAGSAGFNVGNFARTAKLFSEMSKAKVIVEFLLLSAYEALA